VPYSSDEVNAVAERRCVELYAAVGQLREHRPAASEPLDGQYTGDAGQRWKAMAGRSLLKRRVYH
jgi:hypothetical protein